MPMDGLHIINSNSPRPEHTTLQTQLSHHQNGTPLPITLLPAPNKQTNQLTDRQTTPEQRLNRHPHPPPRPAPRRPLRGLLPRPPPGRRHLRPAPAPARQPGGRGRRRARPARRLRHPARHAARPGHRVEGPRAGRPDAQGARGGRRRARGQQGRRGTGGWLGGFGGGELVGEQAASVKGVLGGRLCFPGLLGTQ